MSVPEDIVYLLDDDPGMVKALTRLLRTAGYFTRGFSSPVEFFDVYRPQEIACLVLDVGMPEVNGFDTQKELKSRGILIPIIFLTGRGNIPMSVQAIKCGAMDFLTKPVNDAELLQTVNSALRMARAQHERALETATFAARFRGLTPREREVMAMVVEGKLNKQIAAELGTGEQNIKIHRGRVMEKLALESLTDLVRVADRLGIEKPDNHPRSRV